VKTFSLRASAGTSIDVVQRMQGESPYRPLLSCLAEATACFVETNASLPVMCLEVSCTMHPDPVGLNLSR